MTPEQKLRRLKHGRDRAARLKEAFRRKNPGKIPLPMVTIWPKKR